MLQANTQNKNINFLESSGLYFLKQTAIVFHFSKFLRRFSSAIATKLKSNAKHIYRVYLQFQ